MKKNENANAFSEQEITEKLIYPLWECVSSDFKEKYKADSWGMFENFLRSSAYTESLPRFFEAFKKIMPFEWKHGKEKAILSILESGQDYHVLMEVRQKTSFLVLLARQINQEKKDAFKENFKNQ